MKKFTSCIIFSFAVFLSSCGDSDPLEELYGTWTSSMVFFDNGVTDGLSTLKFNEDGTYSFEARFSLISSTCIEEFSDSGTFNGDESKIEFKALTGAKEVLNCNDSIFNEEKRPYTQNELDRFSYTAEWIIEGDNLDMDYSDGSTRGYTR